MTEVVDDAEEDEIVSLSGGLACVVDVSELTAVGIGEEGQYFS